MCDNYPKGRGELLREYIETYQPEALLIHVKRSSGSHQDLDFEGSVAVYMNCPDLIEFLDKLLRTPGDNIQQENIFIILSSLEMTALAHLCAIIHITICLSTFWLKGNYHILADYT